MLTSPVTLSTLAIHPVHVGSSLFTLAVHMPHVGSTYSPRWQYTLPTLAVHYPCWQFTIHVGSPHPRWQYPFTLRNCHSLQATMSPKPVQLLFSAIKVWPVHIPLRHSPWMPFWSLLVQNKVNWLYFHICISEVNHPVQSSNGRFLL